MNNHSQPKAITIQQLFNNNERYIIPIYQRNYAWGAAEIDLLLQDILDFQPENNQHYFIGSLVVHKRPDGYIELIDGQQRFTTLCILLAAMKKAWITNDEQLKSLIPEKLNLYFESRPNASILIEQWFAIDTMQEENQAMWDAFHIIHDFLKRNQNNRDHLVNSLTKSIQLIQVVVPPDTDLNHYFEIMNNRGEQLEKHEVLKARFMAKLTCNDERALFARIWDACAAMGRAVQTGFTVGQRKQFFGASYPADFDEWQKQHDESKKQSKDIPNVIAGHDTSLATILSTVTKSIVNTKDTVIGESYERYKAIINFPNFLLYALRIFTPTYDISLDDKKLLEHFKEDVIAKPKEFIMVLFQCRLVFDRYLIKRPYTEKDEQFILEKLEITTDGSYSYSRNFADNEAENKKLVMLQSMFHVSFPSPTYKYWLFATIKYLHDKRAYDSEIPVEHFIDFLEKLHTRFFFGHFGSKRLAYADLIFENAIHDVDYKISDDCELLCYPHIETFVFNRLDYLIWKSTQENNISETANICRALPSVLIERTKNFAFTTRSSVEHYFPQHPISMPSDGEKIDANILDKLGNLCLISSSQNSRLSNYLPQAKKEHYKNAKTVESLKQTWMMSYDKWDQEAAQKHHECVIELLKVKP